MRSVVPVMRVAGPGPCIEPGDGFLDLKTFLKMRFISLMIKVKEKDLSIT
jgi:hypothetical protein